MPEDPVPVREVDPQRVTPATGQRTTRRASLGSALVGVAIVSIAIVVMSVRRPDAPSTQVGDAGGTQAAQASLTAFESIVGDATPQSTDASGASASTGASEVTEPLATPWKTSPPSTCNPYVKPCDPTVPPVYHYVRIIHTTSPNADGQYGSGDVTFTANGHAYACTWEMRSPTCYFDIPPGVSIIATQHPRPGSVCVSFYLIWPDFTRIEFPNCAPISFTTKADDAQLVVEFTSALSEPTQPPATDPPATEPPTTAAPTPDTSPETSATPS